MHQELNNFVSYFCLYKGGDNNDTAKTLQAAEKLAHPDITVETGKGLIGKDEFMAFVENFASGGGRADLLSIKVSQDEGTIVYSARVTMPDGKLIETLSTGHFKDGRLFRVVPSDKSKYNSFKEIGEASVKASAKTPAGASTEAATAVASQ